ncbi:hypothetical protein FACUT_438 [Fusarium acutatum]|uniref:Uncharacterized protein n=1 Tax=Fusarium acutatum TaxID=78861 RepID=A0A8H4NTK9_9HYPO|nr:hypothetical protein FACUT_438 [Fusarium acutatum]
MPIAKTSRKVINRSYPCTPADRVLQRQQHGQRHRATLGHLSNNDGLTPRNSLSMTYRAFADASASGLVRHPFREYGSSSRGMSDCMMSIERSNAVDRQLLKYLMEDKLGAWQQDVDGVSRGSRIISEQFYPRHLAAVRELAVEEDEGLGFDDVERLRAQLAKR